MRPLPRVHAFTDRDLLGQPDLGIRAAAIAAGGPAIALHVRARGESGAFLVAATVRLLALARPPEAAVFVSGRSDIAQALGAQGVQLNASDLQPSDARRILVRGWIGCSVHNVEEAATAAQEGADFLVLGNVYQTTSHPGRPAAGLGLLRDTVAQGLPVIAIGGITPARAAEVRAAGAYGVAAISALWYVSDPAAATMALLEPWIDQR
jgi:thiamine-phosphate diphosphorylase